MLFVPPMPLSPMRLLRIPEPFDHPEFIFEPKIDGFRALAYVEGYRCRLVSRNGHVFKGWPQLAGEIAHAVREYSLVLDGEICCLEPDGRSNFQRLMFRRDWPFFYAFDVLSVGGRDVRGLSLLARKRLLRSVMPKVESRLRYLDAVKERGTDLYRVACARDLEGIVAKWTPGVYQADGRGTSWLKINNPEYSQIVGRRDLLEQRRAPHRATNDVMPELRLV
jgi:bifunctional non-homologous end joining protein LigD